MLHLTDFNYQLPPSAIAQDPIKRRADSKLLVLDRQTQQISHHHFSDLPTLLDENYLIVRNNTKVIPARVFGHKSTGGVVELLLIHPDQRDKSVWTCLTKPGLKVDTRLSFTHSELTAICLQDQGYTKLLRFSKHGPALDQELDKIGQTPLPPYIAKHLDESFIRDRYQTIYAKPQGSVAAPTAGLHFTREIDHQLRAKQIDICQLTLHVGPGTFVPVTTDDITKHSMHAETFVLSPVMARRINQAKTKGQKILAVGTTTARVLESCVDGSGVLRATTGQTKLYVYPPYRFQIVDALITNFHYPKSTLLMLVAAFTSWPNTQVKFDTWSRSPIGQVYQKALENQYRFLSFGDAMLIK